MFRSLQFWGNIAPIYVQYRFVQFLNRDMNIIDDATAEGLYDGLHEKYTDKVKSSTFDAYYVNIVEVSSLDKIVHQFEQLFTRCAGFI